MYIQEIYVYERDLYGIYVIHTHMKRDTLRETEKEKQRWRRTETKGKEPSTPTCKQ